MISRFIMRYLVFKLAKLAWQRYRTGRAVDDTSAFRTVHEEEARYLGPRRSRRRAR